MRPRPTAPTAHPRGLTALVAWYGLFQAVHVPVNASYLLGDGPPPFPAPVGGWPEAALPFLDAIAALDLLNAVVAVLATLAWLRDRPRAYVAVAVALGVSLYACGVFTYAVVQLGAWRAATTAQYLLVYVPFLPVVALAAVLTARGSRDDGVRRWWRATARD